MTPSFFKDTLREVLKTLGRFVSIFAIVALGVGFFAGVGATGADMRLSADNYYRQTRLADMRVLSTLGLSGKDVDAVRGIPGVAGVMPSRYVDVITLSEDNIVTRVQALPDLELSDPGYLNQLRLVTGRLPENPGECVIDQKVLRETDFTIGRIVTFAPGKADELLEDTLARGSYTIVGVALTPVHVDSTQRGNTNIGSGSIAAYVYIPEENFITDYYTELYIAYGPAGGEAAYTEDYDGAVEQLKGILEGLETVRAPVRLEEVRTEAFEKIDEAQAELDDGIREMDEKLADAARTIADADQKLADGEQEYKDGLLEYEEEIGKAQKELDDAKKELEDGWEQYREGRDALRDGQEELNKAGAQLGAAKAEYEAQKGGFHTLINMLNSLYFPPYDPGTDPEPTIPASDPTIAYLVNMLNTQFLNADGSSLGFGGLLVNGDGNTTAATRDMTVGAIQGYQQGVEAQFADAQSQYDDGVLGLAEGRKELNDARRELEKGNIKYEEGLAEFEEKKAEAEEKLEDARRKIADGKAELADGKREYEEKKADAEAEVADAQQKLADARRDLDDLELPEWYIQNRGDYTTAYLNYRDESLRIDSISAIFPLFFLAVAALVCLTTMTRMVEEQRTQIGTAKALGYTNAAIAGKYLFYALTATVLGSVTGLVICFKLFPAVIYSAYNTLYSMPANGLLNPFHWDVGVAACLAAAVCAGGVTLFAVYGELAGTPAQIMRPKAPKAGKRVALEYLPFLWNRLTFTYKVTARNLFRYKKRVFMTIIGIAGCTALILTGYGIRDSVGDISRKQYGDITLYDLMVVYDNAKAAEDLASLRAAVESQQGIAIQMDHYSQSVTAFSGKTDKRPDVHLSVMGSPELMPEFITLRSRQSHDPVPFTDGGAVITEKLSILLDLQVGDPFTLRDSDGREFTATVSGITENYAMHYVYMTPASYEEVFGEPPPYNAILINLTDPSLEDHVAGRLLDLDEVQGVVVSSGVQSRVSNMTSSLSLVVVVLIVSAGALAFVVLYNLTNINITERVREIATLKVLGFYDSEVAAYIYRENVILTLIGDGLGLLLGIALTQFVVATAELDSIMFSREIYPKSYLYAFFITLIFAAVVNGVTYFKLKKISMVESMKSVD